MPAVSPMVVTRNRAGYFVDWLKVVNEDVGRPDRLFGGDFETKFQNVRPGVARREMSERPHTFDFRAAENVGDEEGGYYSGYHGYFLGLLYESNVIHLIFGFIIVEDTAQGTFYIINNL